jgi:hypothetical protein
MPLEVAKDDRRPVSFGEPVEFLVKDRRKIVRSRIEAGRGCPEFGCSEFDRPTSLDAGFGLERGPTSDPVEPRSQAIADPEPPAFASEDQKRRLKGVHRFVFVAEDAPADAENHRPMPLDDRFKRRFGLFARSRGEPLEQLAVGQAGCGPDLEKHPEPSARHPVSHWLTLPGRLSLSPSQ